MKSHLYSKFKLKGSKRYSQLGTTADDWVEKWQQNKKYSEYLAAVTQLMINTKYNGKLVSLFPPAYQSLYQGLSGKLNIPDMVYSLECFLTYKQSELPDSPVEAMQKILGNVKVVEKPFSMPRRTFKSKEGSRLSQLCLLKTLMRMKGFETMLFKKGETWGAFLFSDTEFYVIDDGIKKVDELSTVAELQSVKFFYFDYPQAFFNKNEFLSTVLAQSKQVEPYCKNPEFVIRSFSRLFPNKRIEILNEPFEFLAAGMKQNLGTNK